MMTNDEAQFILDDITSLADLKAAGWVPYQSSSGRWWFRRTDGCGKAFLPRWVEEIERAAYLRGTSEVRGMMARALGLKDTSVDLTKE